MPLPLRLRDQPYLLLSLTSLFWAGNAVVGRAVIDKIPPVALAQIRWVGALLILLPFAWTGLRADLPAIRRSIGTIAILSLTGVAAFNTILYWSLHHTTVINATLMQSSGPLLIGLVSWVLFRDPLTRVQLGGIALSLFGVVVVISGGDMTRLAGMSLNIGDVLILLAMAIYSIYSALLRKRPPIGQLSFLAITIALGAVFLVPLTLIEYLSGPRIAELGAGGFAALVYVAVFPSILAYLCFNRGVALIGANRAGPFFHLIPLFGAALAIALLGERLHLFHLAGAALILGGVAVAARNRPVAVTNRVAQSRAGDLDRPS